MANKTVTFNSYLHSGTAGLTMLLLDPETGSIGNGSGDTLTAGSNGQFSAVVTEAITGWWNVVVKNGSVSILEGGRVYFESDTVGSYLVDDQTLIAKEATVSAVSSTVATISSNVTTLLSRITSGVASMFLDLIQMITGSGTANAQWTAKALENVATATGSGARLVSITVLLDAVAQQSARVRLTKGGESYLATTDANGLATFNVDDGSWAVSITLAGATFAGATLVVDGNETVSYSLTAVPALTPSDPDKVTGYWLCLSHLGVPESGVTVTLTAMSLPVNSTGLVLDSASRSVTSGVDGVVSFTNLLPGVRYKVVRNSGKAFYFVCPTYQADPVDLASFIGT